LTDNGKIVSDLNLKLELSTKEYEEAVARTESMGDDIKRHCNLIKYLEYSQAQLVGKYAMAQTQRKSLTDENKTLHTPEGVASKMQLELA